MCHGKGLKHGKGSCRRAIDYLLGDHDHTGALRGGVDVLEGDPYAVAALADSLQFSQRYTSYVYGWAPEEQPTRAEIQALVEDFKRVAFAGMERDRVMFTVIQHTSVEGKIDLHIVVARVDLETGKSFNPCPPGSLKSFDAVRDLHNWTNGWARPDDPDRARLSQPGRVAHAQAEQGEAPRTRAAMLAALEAMVAAGELTNGAEGRDQARQWGEGTREGRDYISIKPPGAGRAARLPGEMFKLSWSAANEPARQARKNEVRSTGRGGVVDLDRAAEARNRLNAAIASRARYNHQRYGVRPAIDPAQVMAQLRAEQQVNHDRNRATAAAAANLVAAAAINRDQRVTDAVERIVAAAGTATGAAERTAAGAGRAAAAARAATAELSGAGGPLRAIAAFCRAAIQRLRDAVEQRIGGGVAVSAGAPAADGRGAADSGGWARHITEFGQWADRAAAALNTVRLPEPEPEPDDDDDDELDAALSAAAERLRQPEPDELDEPVDAVVSHEADELDDLDLDLDQPVPDDLDLDLDSDPLAQPVRPGGPKGPGM